MMVILICLQKLKKKKYTRMFKTSFGFGGRSAAVSVTSEHDGIS